MTHGPALAARDSCAPIAAMITSNSKALQKLSLHIGTGGTLDLRYAGKSTFIGGAEDCELYGPVGDFELSCEWNLTNRAKAEGQFRLFQQKLNRCLPEKLEERNYQPSRDAGPKRRRYSANVDGDQPGYADTDISIVLYENTSNRGSDFDIRLSISR